MPALTDERADAIEVRRVAAEAQHVLGWFACMFGAFNVQDAPGWG